MSDPEGGPSTSRGTRRSGVNPPRTPAAAMESAKKSDDRESTDASRASSGTPSSSKPNKEAQILFTPDYGGSLFTAPRSRKRETKRNSRFSPDVVPTMRQKQPAAEKFDEDPAPAAAAITPIRSLKDTVANLHQSIKKTLKQKQFALPPKFGGKAADLYRQVRHPQKGKALQQLKKEEEAGPSTPARPQRRHSSVAPKPAGGELAFNIGSVQAPATAQKRKQRCSSIPARILDVDALMRELQQPKSEEGAEEDEPPRGRKKVKEEKKEPVEYATGDDLRVLPIPLNVKQEVLSDQEEVPEMPPPAKKARNRASLPPEPAAPIMPAAAAAASSSRGRRKSGLEKDKEEERLVKAKEEMMDDEYEEQQQQGMPRRPSARGGRSEQSMASPQPPKQEEEAVKPKPATGRGSGRGKGWRKGLKAGAQEASTISDQPSTSASAAAATEPAAPAAADRSLSRKRARQSNVSGSTEASKAEEQPVVKRKDTRKSTRPTTDGEEAEAEEEAVDAVEEEEEEKATPGKHRSRRTTAQMLQDSLTEDEKRVAEENPDEGHATRRRSFRGNLEDAATAAVPATTRPPRVPKSQAVPATGSQVGGRLRATFDDEELSPPVVYPPITAVDLGSVDFAADDGAAEGGGEKGDDDAIGREAKPSTSSLNSSSRMLEEAADNSGYGGDESSQEDAGRELAEIAFSQSADEGAAKEEEEEASTSAAAAAELPVKRGRGRPPKDGSTPKPPKPKKESEYINRPQSPMVREKRSTALNSSRFQEYMMAETTKINRRASAGGGMAPTPSRTLAAAGVAFDLPAARVRPATPPPPEVKAAPGSALAIMREMKKKKMPSMRSPSPTQPASSSSQHRSSSSSRAELAASSQLLPQAPPIEAAAATAAATGVKKEEKSPEPAGSSHQTASSSSAQQQPQPSGPVQKDELADLGVDLSTKPHVDSSLKEDNGGKKEKGSGQSVVTGNVISSAQEEVEKAAPPPPNDDNWITFDNIRGNAKRDCGRLVTQDPMTGELVQGEPFVPKERVKKKVEEKKKEEPENQKKEEEPEKAAEETPPEPAVKKEPLTEADSGGVHDLLAKWQGSREEIDQRRAEAGVPVLPPDMSAAPLAARASRRSINAPSRYGDYDLNFGDPRKRSSTIGGPATLPMSPALPDAAGKKRNRKKEEAAATLTPAAAAADDADWEEEQPSSSVSRKKSSPKKDPKRPPLKLKIKLGTNRPAESSAAATPTSSAAAAAEEEEEEDYGLEGMDDDMFGESSEFDFEGATPAAAPATAATPTSRKRDKRRTSKKQFAPKWKRQPVPHLGHIELDNFVVESVTLTCAGAIDSMLSEVCADGIPKSTLTVKEQASEHSRLSVAKRRAMGIIGQPAPPGGRPKPAPLPIPPREERTKRIRHAPQSKEYDNLTTALVGDQQPMANPPPSFHALAGLVDRKPPTERRKESRQDAAAHKKASIAAAIDHRAEAKEVEVLLVEKPKKEKKREREREREPPAHKNTISYRELLRQKTHNMERLPGRVLNDPTDFFYREIFTDDIGDGIPEANSLDVDVEGFAEPVPDDMKAIGPTAIGALAEEVAAKVLQMLPRPQPYPDEDDGPEEGGEWMEGDMNRALAHHSKSRLQRLEKVLLVLNSQRMADLAVQGTKGSQDVLYNSHVKHACQLKELLPVFSQFHLAEVGWLHRSLLRLLPAHLLPVYLETLRFLRYIDSKLAGELGKALLERGTDADWDVHFEPEHKTDDDRTQPMMQGSEPATAANSSELIPVAAAAAADDVNDVTAAIDAVLKSIEKSELEEAAAAADAAPAASPDSDQGLVIDEEPQEQEQEKEAAAAAEVAADVAAAAAPTEAEEVKKEGEEEVITEELVKPELKQLVELLAEVTERKVREANADAIQGSINPLQLGDVIPILIAPVFEMDDAPDDWVMKNKAYEYMYRLIRYATPNPDKFKTIRPRIPSGECSVAEAMDAAVECVAAVVRSAVKNKGNGRVVLFGWGLSCYLNLKVAQTAHGISAIINFAFPLRTADGWRGTPDDDITLTYCPTLFVMGTEAADFDPYQLLAMRMNMIQSPGALVLGCADAQLNISSLRLSRERITQKIAARMILEQVIEFINLPGNQLERAKLVPLPLANIYFVEPAAIARAPQETPQAQLASGPAGKRPIAAYTPVVGAERITEAQMLERRRQQQLKDEKRKRSRIEDQTTVAARYASSIASSAAPITKRSRTDDLPSTSYGGPGRIGPADYRFSHPGGPGPSPLASPSLNSPGYRMTSRPAILSHAPHHQHYYHSSQPSPISGGPSTSAAAAASGLLQTSRPAAAAPSPRGPLDPASISLS